MLPVRASRVERAHAGLAGQPKLIPAGDLRLLALELTLRAVDLVGDLAERPLGRLETALNVIAPIDAHLQSGDRLGVLGAPIAKVLDDRQQTLHGTLKLGGAQDWVEPLLPDPRRIDEVGREPSLRNADDVLEYVRRTVEPLRPQMAGQKRLHVVRPLLKGAVELDIQDRGRGLNVG